jgi:hypothetical protein
MGRALIVGINYTGKKGQLNGCVNDAKNMALLLKSKNYDCEVMTDDVVQTSAHGLPTRNNILKALLELILTGQKELFFHYSGHGSQVADENGDERDGKDETLVPLDYETNGMITDDELRGILCCLRSDQRLIMVLDCCHSGTGIDAAYNLYKSYVGNNYLMFKDDSKTETSGQVIMISGCLDHQTSADAYISGTYQGALSATIQKYISEPGMNWIALVKNTREDLRRGGYSQYPNLTSGRKLDLYSKIF